MTLNLKEILQKIVDNKESILLNDNNQDWEVNILLETLSESKLKVNAYFQSNLYIAEIDPRGYLGRVLYKVKQKK